MKINPIIQKSTDRFLKMEFAFPKKLKQHRLEKGLTPSGLGMLIDKASYQIQRYEKYGGQMPNLETFVNICIALQVDPKELLGIEKTDAWFNPEEGVIYDWKLYKLEGDKQYYEFRWLCSKCQTINIEYDAYNKRKSKMVRKDFICEFCDAMFYKIQENDDE